MPELLNTQIGNASDFPDGYRMTELGILPTDWKIVRLGEVAKVRGGTAFPHKYQGKRIGKYPFFKVSDMNLPVSFLVASFSIPC